MQRTRITLVVVTIALVLILYSLPKVVVDNNEEGIEDTPGSSTETSLPEHNIQISEEEKKLVELLTQRLQQAENNKKSAIFADSLAALFRELNLFDSTAKYTELKAIDFPNEENWLATGEAYYEAQTFSQDPAHGDRMAKKAREYFEKVLATDSGNLEVVTKMAMTYVASPNPMQGISLLRQVLEQDPENETALFNMGMLSLQSAQYKLAVERFSKLVDVNPDNLRARFYLGISYLENGEKGKAKEQFEIVKLEDKDPEVQANVDAYLNEIN